MMYKADAKSQKSIGFALLSLLIGALSANTLIKSIPYVIQCEVTGGEPVRLAVKSIVNALISVAVAQLFTNLLLMDMLMVPFAAITFMLAAIAIYLGAIKG